MNIPERDSLAMTNAEQIGFGSCLDNSPDAGNVVVAETPKVDTSGEGFALREK
jgi:hypothetical protein